MYLTCYSGLGKEGYCGCGVTGCCESPDVKCNCDINDGVSRMDFGKCKRKISQAHVFNIVVPRRLPTCILLQTGLVIDKEDLPIGSLHLKDIVNETSAAFKVGRLRCAPLQIGLFYSLLFIIFCREESNFCLLANFRFISCKEKSTFQAI